MLLVLPAAFETPDHRTFPEPEVSGGTGVGALFCSRSIYLWSHVQKVVLGDCVSVPGFLSYGVLQSTVLLLTLFNIYMNLWVVVMNWGRGGKVSLVLLTLFGLI